MHEVDLEVRTDADFPRADGCAEDSDAGAEFGVIRRGRETAELSDGEIIGNDCENVEVEVLSSSGSDLIGDVGEEGSGEIFPLGWRKFTRARCC